jgi:hypothetical protein
LFTFEVIVKRTLGNASRLSDVFDTARAEASRDELLHGGFEDGITRGAARQPVSFGGFCCPHHSEVQRQLRWIAMSGWIGNLTAFGGASA